MTRGVTLTLQMRTQRQQLKAMQMFSRTEIELIEMEGFMDYGS